MTVAVDWLTLVGVGAQLLMTAYFMGRLTQRVIDMEKRVDRLAARCEEHLGFGE